MSGKKHVGPSGHGLPLRPPTNLGNVIPPIHSSSVPSTPNQRPRKYSFESREISPTVTQNHSPRSAYSETNGNVPSLRPLPPRGGGCRFETAPPHSRRRIPYSWGNDRLEQVDKDKIMSKLPDETERELSTDMRELYDRLLPTDEIEEKREKLVQKLERIFNTEWPGKNIRVHKFGSSGNLLCSDDSDVDICITMDSMEGSSFKGVCSIAELLATHGMEKVVCVSSAKVPIVKVWDPETGLACDMNVNNTIALENTRMVRTYVQIDDRVRPLAMIIKYWTRRRTVNDAAFGGTLSSYTWICLIIAFLQLRSPPLLPALHEMDDAKVEREDGSRSAFADNLDKLRGFGAKNKDSLGVLLFQFFRFYAHELDYDTHALSIKSGVLFPKKDRQDWNRGMNNTLCVEEPFTTSRNLGNTVDDYTFRGLHLELRRAFDLVSQGKLKECCEQYVFPKEEEKIFQKPATTSRPVLLRASSHQHSNRGGRGGFRGGRQYRQGNGNSNGGNNNNNNNNNNNGANHSNRRAASLIYDPSTNPTMLPSGLQVPLAPQDLLWYTTSPPNVQQLSVQHDLLGSTLNTLITQEASLRFHLYNQAQQINQQQALAHAQRMQNNGTPQATDRPRTNSVDAPPLTAPARPDIRDLRPEVLYSMGYPFTSMQAPALHYYAHPAYTSYPSSPSTVTASTPALSGPGASGATAATPEFRRSPHRLKGDNGAPTGSGALRSQSQPASRSSMPSAQAATPTFSGASRLSKLSSLGPLHIRRDQPAPVPNFMPDEPADAEWDEFASTGQAPIHDSPPQDEGPPRYIGYYVSDTPQSNSGRIGDGLPDAIPAGQTGQTGPTAASGGQDAPRWRRPSTEIPQTVLDRRIRRTSSRSPSPLGASHARAYSVGVSSAPLSSAPFPASGGSRVDGLSRGPMVVNGSSNPFKPDDFAYYHARSANGASMATESMTPSHAYSNWEFGVAATPPDVGMPGFLWPDQGPGSNHVKAKQESSPRPLSDRPLIANGSSSNRPSASPALYSSPSPIGQIVHEPITDASFHQRMAAMGLAIQNGLAYPSMATDRQPMPSAAPSSVSGRGSRSSRQGSGIAQLDLAGSEYGQTTEPQQHLSPVYEHHTPSPDAARKLESTAPSSGAPPSKNGTNGKEQQTRVKTPSSVGTSPRQPPSKASSQSAKALSLKIPLGAASDSPNSRSPVSSEAKSNGSASKDAKDGLATANPRSSKATSLHESSCGWQKAIKSRKKNGNLSVDLRHSSSVNATAGQRTGTEQMPKNDLDRKGG